MHYKIMIDPILGVLTPDARMEGCLLGSLVHEGRQIAIRVNPDGTDLEGCLAVTRHVATSLTLLLPKARAVAADKLLENYNENWRMCQRARADGTMEDIENPPLSSIAFGNRLLLDGLSVTGGMLEFCFADDGLFAGHSVFVSSFDGAGFTDTDAALFG